VHGGTPSEWGRCQGMDGNDKRHKRGSKRPRIQQREHGKAKHKISNREDCDENSMLTLKSCNGLNKPHPNPHPAWHEDRLYEPEVHMHRIHKVLWWSEEWR